MALVLSLLVLTAFALLGGAAFLWRRNGFSKQVWLMLLLALVIVVNIGIWMLPNERGETLIEAEPVLPASEV